MAPLKRGAGREQSCQFLFRSKPHINMTSTSTPISPSNFPSSDIAPVVMSPAAAAHPPPSQPPSDDETEPLPRPDTPTGRKKEQSKLSPDAKGNVRAAVRAVLGKGHRDDQECFCLVTGFSADKRILNYAHVVPGAMSFDEVSSLVNTWFMLLTVL